MEMLAEMTWGQWLLSLLLIFVCWLLMLVILLQKNRGGGLAGAFGSGGGSGAFGAKTGDVFTWFTVIVTGIFVVLASAANFVFDESAVRATPEAGVAPAEPGSTETPSPVQTIPVRVGADGKLEPIGGPGDQPFKIEMIPSGASPAATPATPPEGKAEPVAPSEAVPPPKVKPAEESPKPEEKKEPSTP